MHLQTCSIPVSKCISKFARSRSFSVSLSSLDFSLQVHYETHFITASKYIFQDSWRVYRDTGVPEVGRVTESIYSADCRVHRHHRISISSYYTIKFPTLSFSTVGLTRSVRDFVDPCNGVDRQHQVVSYLLIRILHSWNQNHSFSYIPFGCSMCMSWCSSNYARVSSAARLTVFIYIDLYNACHIMI